MIAAIVRAIHAVALLVATQDPLVVYMSGLLPSDDDDLRLELAVAIRSVTRDRQEQRVLARIARFESNYRRDVAECETAGKEGELSSFQILPTAAVGRAEICDSITAGARIALAMVRESLRACSQLPEPERLALYARGSCASEAGRRLSRVRWAP